VSDEATEEDEDAELVPVFIICIRTLSESNGCPTTTPQLPAIPPAIRSCSSSELWDDDKLSVVLAWAMLELESVGEIVNSALGRTDVATADVSRLTNC